MRKGDNCDLLVITQSRRLPLGATLLTLQQAKHWCWPGQNYRQWLGNMSLLLSLLLQQTKTAELEACAGLHGTPVDAEQQIPDETDMQAGPQIEPTTTGSNSPSELPGASSDRLQPAGALIVKAFSRQNAQQQTRVHPPLADTWTAA